MSQSDLFNCDTGSAAQYRNSSYDNKAFMVPSILHVHRMQQVRHILLSRAVNDFDENGVVLTATGAMTKATSFGNLYSHMSISYNAVAHCLCQDRCIYIGVIGTLPYINDNDFCMSFGHLG